jgi:hypothetical protein
MSRSSGDHRCQHWHCSRAAGRCRSGSMLQNADEQRIAPRPMDVEPIASPNRAWRRAQKARRILDSGGSIRPCRWPTRAGNCGGGSNPRREAALAILQQLRAIVSDCSRLGRPPIPIFPCSASRYRITPIADAVRRYIQFGSRLRRHLQAIWSRSLLADLLGFFPRFERSSSML